MNPLVTIDPFRGVRALQHEINRLFDQDLDTSLGGGSISQWLMRVDIKETDEQLVIRADLPGMEQKDIQVNVENGGLTIAGERQFQEEETRASYHRVERSYGRFSRTFQLPNTVDVEHIKATYRNGVLEVVLPKLEQAKPRTVQVAVEE